MLLNIVCSTYGWGWTWIDPFTNAREQEQWGGLHYSTLIAWKGTKQLPGESDLKIGGQTMKQFRKKQLLASLREKPTAFSSLIVCSSSDTQETAQMRF